MNASSALLAGLFLCAALKAQTAPPALEEVRKGMGVASAGEMRGQKDAVGFASTAEQMAKVWELSEAPPAPEALGPLPRPGVLGLICPHDDYLYAGRMYRQLVPLVTARTVVILGVFHKYSRFGARNKLVFDPYRSWRSPDGPIPVSGLREALLAGMPKDEVLQDAAMHDSEHSVEAIAYWLKHQRRDLEIVPILIPAASFDRFQVLAQHLGGALAAAMKRRHESLGQDLAIVISSDGIHYGADFHHTPFGAGGVDAFSRATARDRDLLRGPLAGPVSEAKAGVFFQACVDPASPDTYRMPWCGRFSVPFGLLLLAETSKAMGRPAPVGRPVAFGVSVDVPELPVKSLGMGATAPASLYHFVGFPGVAFVAE